MKKYFDRFGAEIKIGMMLIYEWADGCANYVGPVVEREDDLGVIVDYSSEFVSLSTTDLPHARIAEKG